MKRIVLCTCLFGASCGGVIGLTDADVKRAREQKRMALIGPLGAAYLRPDSSHLPGVPDQGFASISQREEASMNDTMNSLEGMGFTAIEDWAKAGESAMHVVSDPILTEAEVENAVDQDLRGTYTAAPAPAIETIVARERVIATQFMDHIASEVSTYDTETLIQMRFKFSAGLLVNQTMASNSTEKSLPPEILILNVEMLSRGRDIVNAELQRRGVTDL